MKYGAEIIKQVFLFGNGFKYMMVFDNNPINGADNLANALNNLKQL